MARDPSMEQTALGLMTTKGIDTDLRFSPRETEILRELAKKVAELAARPVEEEKKKLWYDLNDLRPVRPLVFCDPENGWNEIITQDMLKCEDKLARVWEMTLRKEIFWGEEMRDDRVIQPYFDVPYYYEDTEWGVEKRIVGEAGQEHGGSVRWEAAVADYEEDFDKLSYPEITVDYERTDRMVELAEDLFGGVLSVRLRGVWWWSLGMTMDFVYIRGLENLMLDMYDNPDGVHKMMAFLRDGYLHKLDFLEKNNLLSLNTEGTYVGSGGFGWTDDLPQPGFDGRHVRLKDMWGFTESQETVGVSTEMFGEFIFPYQKPIQERFGLNCYGCCEPLDPRWELIKTVPRLRRVSVSPWADRAKMAEYLGNDYVLSMKPSPTPLASHVLDEGSVRVSLREDMRKVKGRQVEVIMKDNHTLGGNPDNAVRWTRIAKQEAQSL